MPRPLSLFSRHSRRVSVDIATQTIPSDLPLEADFEVVGIPKTKESRDLTALRLETFLTSSSTASASFSKPPISQSMMGLYPQHPPQILMTPSLTLDTSPLLPSPSIPFPSTPTSQANDEELTHTRLQVAFLQAELKSRDTLIHSLTNHPSSAEDTLQRLQKAWTTSTDELYARLAVMMEDKADWLKEKATMEAELSELKKEKDTWATEKLGLVRSREQMSARELAELLSLRKERSAWAKQEAELIVVHKTVKVLRGMVAEQDQKMLADRKQLELVLSRLSFLTKNVAAHFEECKENPNHRRLHAHVIPVTIRRHFGFARSSARHRAPKQASRGKEMRILSTIKEAPHELFPSSSAGGVPSRIRPPKTPEATVRALEKMVSQALSLVGDRAESPTPDRSPRPDRPSRQLVV